jgi:spore coat protein CotH
MNKYRILVISLLILAFANSCKKDDDNTVIIDPGPVVPGADIAYVFDINAVPEVTLEITTAEWNKLLHYYDQNPQNEEYIAGNFTFVKDGQSEEIDSTAIRLKGNTSRRRPEGDDGQVHNSTNPDWHHVHFSLNFKKYVKGQRFHTLHKLNLKWFKDDGDYAREVYCYDLFERYGIWTAPKSSYCRLTIRIKEDSAAAYYGVYQMVEVIDEDFISNRSSHLTSTDGNLWKGNYGADFRIADQTKMGIDYISLDPSQSRNYAYDLKTNDDQLASAKGELSTFITSFNTLSDTAFLAWVNNTMDVNFFLKTYAVNVMVGMWDDYWVNSNNFYFYFDPQGKAWFIPYDYDNTLGTSLLMDNSGTQDPLHWGSGDNPLVEKLLSFPQYKAIYIAYLHELADPSKDLFEYSHSVARIEAWQAMIGPYVSNDTGEDMVIEDKPAYWANCPFYRLLSGGDQGTGISNYFKTRANHLPLQ